MSGRTYMGPASNPADQSSLDALARQIEELRSEDLDIGYPRRLYLRTQTGERIQLNAIDGPSFTLTEDDGTVTTLGAGGGSLPPFAISDITGLQAILDTALLTVHYAVGYEWGAKWRLYNPTLGAGEEAGFGIVDEASGAQAYLFLDANGNGVAEGYNADYSEGWSIGRYNVGGRIKFDSSHAFDFTITPWVPDGAYNATGWDGSREVPTKNAVRDKIEAVIAAIPVAPTVSVLGQSAVAVPSTGVTTEVVLATIPVPAGAMGANGQITLFVDFSVLNNANNKVFKVKFGGTTILNITSASIAGYGFEIQIANRNNQASQRYVTRRMSSTGTGSYSASTATEDTTTAKNIVITGQLAVGTDTITLESYQAVIMAKA